jgi:TatD DNase family protein
VFSIADTHCHLDFDAFDGDRDEVISRARDTGVVRMLNPGIDLSSSSTAIRLADSYEEVFVACGVHPNDALSWNDESEHALRRMVNHPKVVAVGEIGLDYYRDRAPRDMQKVILGKQLAVAGEAALPVVIHNRQASEDTLELLSAWHADLVSSGSTLAAQPGVLHSFSGDHELAARAVEMNFMIGITGPITYRNADDLRQVVRSIPLSALLIETDAPFLTPQPRRGERNEPAYVAWVAEKIAETKCLPIQEVMEQTTANSYRLFHW